MLKCSLCDYGDAYILVKRRITVTGAGADAASRQADEKNKSVIFKNCAPFIKRTSKINNMETNNAVNIPIVMPMYNSDIYFFSVRVFFHRHWQFIEQQGKRGDHFFPLYLFHPLTNIETFICNFASEMTMTYF